MSRFSRNATTLILSLVLIACASTFPTLLKDLHLDETEDSDSPNFSSSTHSQDEREFSEQLIEELLSVVPQIHTRPKEKLSSSHPPSGRRIAEPTTHPVAELEQKPSLDSDEKDHQERLEKPMSEHEWKEELSDKKLELDEGSERCEKRAIVNSKHYEEFVSGHGWLRRLCAFGTIYNSDTCSCSDMDIPRGKLYPFKLTESEKEEDDEADSQSVELTQNQNNNRPSEANGKKWMLYPSEPFTSEETDPDNKHDSVEKVKSIKSDSISISSSEKGHSSVDRIQEVEEQEEEGVGFDRDTTSENRGARDDSSEGNDKRSYVEKEEREETQSESDEKVSPEGEKAEVTDENRPSVDGKQRWRKLDEDLDSHSTETLGESAEQDDVTDSQEKAKPGFDGKEKNHTCFLGRGTSDEDDDKDSVQQKPRSQHRDSHDDGHDDSHDENSLKEGSQVNAQLKGMSAEIDSYQSIDWDEENEEGVMSSSHEEDDIKTSMSRDRSDSTENDMKTRPISKDEFRGIVRYFRKNFIDMFQRFLTEWANTMTSKYE